MIYSVKLALLQISPRVWVENNQLLARTSLIYQIFNTFFYSRTVVVDKKRKFIKIVRKTFWFYKSYDRILFDDLEYIDISHREVSENYGMTSEGIGAIDVTDIYYVQVKKKNNALPISLFRFIGNGEKYKGGLLERLFPKWNIGIDWVGYQREKAQIYADLISKYTGIPLWWDRNLEYTFKAQDYKCPKCGQVSNSAVRKCIYCGFSAVEEE
jgi:hypothetical protein